MEEKQSKPYLGLSFYPDLICGVKVNDGQIEALAGRELIQPFDYNALLREGQLSDWSSIVEDLNDKLDGNSCDVGVCLYTGMAFIRKVPIALGLQVDMVREHLLWEVEQCLISSIDDYFVEFQKLPFHTPDGNPYYVVAYIRKQAISGLKSLLAMSGLKLTKVDIDVFSSIRTMNYNYDINGDEISVLIDIHREYLCFVFMQKGEYLLSHRMTLVEDKADSVFRTHSEVSEMLLKELKRLVFGHKLGHGIEDLEAIFLYGSENVAALLNDLAAATTVPVSIANPFQRLQATDSVRLSQVYSQYPERFVASVGALLDHVPSPQI